MATMRLYAALTPLSPQKPSRFRCLPACAGEQRNLVLRRGMKNLLQDPHFLICLSNRILCCVPINKLNIRDEETLTLSLNYYNERRSTPTEKAWLSACLKFRVGRLFVAVFEKSGCLAFRAGHPLLHQVFKARRLLPYSRSYAARYPLSTAGPIEIWMRPSLLLSRGIRGFTSTGAAMGLMIYGQTVPNSVRWSPWRWP